MVTGMVKKTKIGFNTAFKKANTIAKIKAVKKLLPSILTPGNNQANNRLLKFQNKLQSLKLHWTTMKFWIFHAMLFPDKLKKLMSENHSNSIQANTKIPKNLWI